MSMKDRKEGGHTDRGCARPDFLPPFSTVVEKLCAPPASRVVNPCSIFCRPRTLSGGRLCGHARRNKTMASGNVMRKSPEANRFSFRSYLSSLTLIGVALETVWYTGEYFRAISISSSFCSSDRSPSILKYTRIFWYPTFTSGDIPRKP